MNITYMKKKTWKALQKAKGLGDIQSAVGDLLEYLRIEDEMCGESYGDIAQLMMDVEDSIKHWGEASFAKELYNNSSIDKILICEMCQDTTKWNALTAIMGLSSKEEIPEILEYASQICLEFDE